MQRLVYSIFFVGVTPETLDPEKRAIVFSNCISALLLFVNLLIFVLIPQNHNLSAAREALIATVVFSVPFLLNRLRWYTFCRLYLSCVPPLLITFYMISGMRQMNVIPVSYYDGLRYYLVACGVLPYLLLSRRELGWLPVAVAPSLLALLFCDQLFELAGVGYAERGIQDAGYSHVWVRSIVAYFVITGSSITLRYLIESADETNRTLLHELEEKNRLIKQHADDKVQKMNATLMDNVRELRRREFILNQSQRIARIGSWEFKPGTGFTFWSDEMYNIFGIDRDTKPGTLKLYEIMSAIDAELLSTQIRKVVDSGIPYDMTIRTITPLGYTKWIRVYAYPAYDDESRGARGICHDITYYKESEKLLQERENNYRSVFEQAFIPIVITDRRGIILDANDSMANLTGATKEDLIARNILSLVESVEPGATPIELPRLQRGENLFTDLRLRHRGGWILEVEASAKRFGEDKLMLFLRDVSEIRRAYRQKEESDARFRTAFEHSAIGMAIVTLDAQFLQVNDELCRIVGYSHDELLSRSFRDITFAEDLPEDMVMFRQISAGLRNTYQREKRYIHKDGHIVWVNISVSLVRDAAGKPLYLVTQIENITNRKRAQLELMEAEAKFRTLVEKSLVGVYILQDDLFKYVNPAFTEITGYTDEDVLGRLRVMDLIHPEFREVVDNNIQLRLTQRIDSMRYELRGITKNGKSIWVEAFGSQIVYEGRAAIIGTLIDITERKLHEREEALLASIVNSSEDAIISSSLDGIINSWNPGAERIFGYSPESVVGKSIGVLFGEDNTEERDTFTDAIIKGSSTRFPEMRMRQKTGNRVDVSVTISPLRDDQGNIHGAAVIAHDVTFRVQAEKAIRASEARYRTLVDNAIEALVLLNVGSGQFVDVSESASRFFNLTREELLERGLVDVSPEFQPGGDRSDELAKKYIGEAVRLGNVAFDWVHTDRDGNEIQCEVRLVRLPSEDEILIRGSIIDITERLLHERELAEANKKVGEMKLMALRSVMSPHFVFNVLNSIQYYIAKNDRRNAISYLSTFSKLIRSILTHSVNNKIRLSEELDMLKNYIDLELIRFEQKFTYSINVDDDIDAEGIEIPSLLIQPFVENAILHGLYARKNAGKLDITVRNGADKVLFVIEDNGIGRKAAREMKSKNLSSHKSVGIKLTEERLKLINRSQDVSLDIEDLVDGDVALGTRVVISVHK